MKIIYNILLAACIMQGVPIESYTYESQAKWNAKLFGACAGGTAIVAMMSAVQFCSIARCARSVTGKKVVYDTTFLGLLPHRNIRLYDELEQQGYDLQFEGRLLVFQNELYSTMWVGYLALYGAIIFGGLSIENLIAAARQKQAPGMQKRIYR